MVKIIAIICLAFLLGHVNCLISDINNLLILRTTIVTEDDEKIELEWTKADTFLANEHLPIWKTTFVVGRLRRDSNIMKRIGKFISYYDFEKSSAIILVEKKKCIYGIIDVRFLIVCLPLDQLDGRKHKVGDREHVVRRETNFESFSYQPGTRIELFKSTVDSNYNKESIFYKPCRLSSYQKNLLKLNETSILLPHPLAFINTSEINRNQDAPMKSRAPLFTVYPEILILISNEIAQTIPDSKVLVLQYIVQFNAVAMLFAKLEKSHNIKIHINLAGIIIDRCNQFSWNYMFEKEYPPSAVSVLNKVMKYIMSVEDDKRGPKSIFTYDAIDMFFLSTSKKWEERQMYPGGFPSQIYDLLRIRKADVHWSQKKILGSLIDGRHILQQYINAADEIANLMTDGINDAVEDNFSICRHHRRAIIRAGRRCSRCLNWRSENVNNLIRYLTLNTNRCFLLNQPRSLYSYGQPIKSLSPDEQCLCYGYWPKWEQISHFMKPLSITNNCFQRLQCIYPKNMTLVNNAPFPIDGTPCDKSDVKKVCWSSRCISQPYIIAPRFEN